jgi:hypothetical protein
LKRTTERRWLGLILTAYVLLASLYSIVTPVFEASDELWHYPMVQYLATHNLALPPQDPAANYAWRQEGSQPPLYYLAAALLTAPIDTSDMETIRRINPHADIGTVRPDGNANMITHRTELEGFPWHGTVLAVHVARFFSVLLGLGTVLVTYGLARELFPTRVEVALGATALNAFLPMFLFISGSINNDNLSNLCGNLLLLLIVRLLKAQRAPSVRFYALVGVVAGAGLLAKLSIGALIPLVALALGVLALRLRDWRPLIIGGLVSGVLTIAIAGWWYLRNAQLYGDPTGLNMFLDIVGRRAIPANAAQLWAERHSFTQAFWGFFGGVNVPLPEAVYLVFNVIGGIGIIGAVAFILYKLFQKSVQLNASRKILVWLPHAVTLLWITITMVSYLRWTAETWASQGRLVFVALSPILVWMALGLTWWLPKRARGLLIGAGAAFFLLVAVLAPFTIIAPAYAAPAAVEGGPVQALFTAAEGGRVGLVSTRSVSETVHPGEYVQFEIDWQIDAPLQRNWSLFAHLVTSENVIIAQRDVYPGGGTLATSDLAAGYAWRNLIAIQVPAAAYAPETLSVQIGWYDLSTGERLSLPENMETHTAGMVKLEPRASTLAVPNPLSINFDNQIELVGYELSTLAPAAGETVELTLYWRALQPVPEDYVVFAHILDPRSSTQYAGSDAMPADWTQPTSIWQPGEIIVDTHTMTVNADTPPDIYEVEVGLYLNPEPGIFQRLRVVTPDGGMADDFAYLSRVRVLPQTDTPPATEAAPQEDEP